MLLAPPTVELEDGGEDTFLETRFKIGENNSLRMWLKNDNEKGTEIWRYQNFASYGKYQQKKAVMQAALRKVHHMASDQGMLYKSAQDKLREFTRAGYPKGVRRYVCVVYFVQSYTFYKLCTNLCKSSVNTF